MQSNPFFYDQGNQNQGELQNRGNAKSVISPWECSKNTPVSSECSATPSIFFLTQRAVQTAKKCLRGVQNSSLETKPLCLS